MTDLNIQIVNIQTELILCAVVFTGSGNWMLEMDSLKKNWYIESEVRYLLVE